MTPPILIISDTHYHNWQYCSQTGPTGVNSRLADIIRATLEAVKHLRSKGGTKIIHCGDVFHVRGNIPPNVLNPVMDMYEAIVGSGIEVLAISGNHDLESNTYVKACSSVTALKHAGVQVMDQLNRVGIGRQIWHFLPWVPNVDELKRQAAALATKVVKGDNVLVIHAPLNGVIMGIPDHGLNPKDFEGLGYHTVFVGHYHNHKAFDFIGGKAYSVGALTHQTWGDADALAGYCLYYPDTGEVEHFETSAPRFVKVDHRDVDTHMDVQDNYIKVVGGEYHHPSEIEEVRDAMIVRGAKSVQVEGLVTKPSVTRAMTTSAAPSVESILSDWIDRKYPGEPDVKTLALGFLKDTSSD